MTPRSRHERIQETALQMNRDYQIGEYQCLVGRQFAVDEEIFVVRELATEEDRMLVHANTESDVAAMRTFVITEVLERLLVDEEIELFRPTYLGR
jgi:hypothetical protein